jgi:hypothetical protein
MFYESWLPPYKEKENLKVLEVGTLRGDSLLGWAEYFKSASVFGLSYGSNSILKPERAELLKKHNIQILRGDQGKEEVIKELCQNGPFDVVIDDGSHYPPHQIFTFANIWSNCMNSGGIYVIEDLMTSYWDKKTFKYAYGYDLSKGGIGRPPPYNAVEKFKQLVDVLNKNQINYRSMSILPKDDLICRIEFAPNSVAIKRCTESEQKNKRKINSMKNRNFEDKHMQDYLANVRRTNPKVITV